MGSSYRRPTFWRRIVIAIPFFLSIGTGSATAQISVTPVVQVSPQSNFNAGNVFVAQKPRITFQRNSGRFGVVYWARNFQNNALVSQLWSGTFLTQDGVRLTSPLGLIGDSGFGPTGLMSVLPFPNNDAILGTFQYYDDLNSGLAFGNNVFVGDAVGVGFAAPNTVGSIVDYTNSGGDKSAGNNCGENEDAGPSTVDTTQHLFFLSYVQDSGFQNSNGGCVNSSSRLMGAYHLNGSVSTISSNPSIVSSQFSSGPFTIDSNASAFGRDAAFNPITGQVWFEYTIGNLMRIRTITPAGPTGLTIDRPTSNTINYARLAINPANGRALVVWSDGAAVLKSETFDAAGNSLGAATTLTDASMHLLQAMAVSANADTFLVLAIDFDPALHEKRVIARVLDSAGQPRSEWTRIDDIRDEFNTLLQVDTIDLAANTFRGTYGVVLGTNTSSVFFEEVTATAGVPLTVTLNGNGTGTVTSSPAGISCPGTCSASFDSGTVVTLSAAAGTLSDFAGWGGACGADPCTVTLTTPQSVTATFTKQTFTVSVTEIGAGKVISTPAGINCPGTCSAIFDGGTAVTFAASPDPGWRSAGFASPCVPGSVSCDLTITGNTAISATFIQQFTLAAASAGSGGGTVTSAPAGISCGPDCAAPFDIGTIVSLTATADATSRFAGWSGDCSGMGACAVTMSAARSVTANFVRQYTLTAGSAGSGGGAITSAPAGISCPGACSASFDVGTPVSLTASPDASSRFAGWSGDCSGTGACNLTMSGDHAATATFVRQATLTVSETGTGAGTVTSSPAGINCPGTCSANFDLGTPIVLAASPDGTSAFTAWSGACTGGSCAFTLNAAASVTADFFRIIYPVAVSIAGSGGGTVISAPAGISCPGTCTADFNAASSVTLTAQPDATSRFAGWSGSCSGTGVCTLSITSAQSATAIFVRQYALTVSIGGNGSGTVASVPAGISCSSGVCSALFDAGTPVALSASPAGTSTFGGWSGACSGAGACSVTMTAAMNVGATFDVTIAGVSASVSTLTPIIGAGNVSSLTGKLSAAQAAVARGNRTAAANQLSAFINELQALVRSGRLDAATAALLIAQAQALINAL